MRRRIPRTWPQLRAYHSEPHGNADGCPNLCSNVRSDRSAVGCADNVANSSADKRADTGPYAPLCR